MENVVPPMPGSHLEEVGSCLSETIWKASQLHINVTTYLWRNYCSCLVFPIALPRFLSRPVVTVNMHSPEKKYSPVIIYWQITTYLLVNKYSLQEVSIHVEIIWSVLLSISNFPGNSIFLGNVYSIVKPLYRNIEKQPLKVVPLYRCS